MNTPDTLPYGPRPELNGTYPYPEVLADWKWLHDELEAGRLAEYRGGYVAAHNGHIVGADTDERRLCNRVQSELGIERFRVVVTFVDD